MAIEILHSRTATLVDGPSNPGYDADELQAADWNAAHPVTADGMGLLFADSAGAVAETMTVDMGTLTASTPLTFKQTWDNDAQDVTFQSVVIEIDRNGIEGAEASSYFSVIETGSPSQTVFKVSAAGVDVRDTVNLYNGSVDTAPIAATLTDGGLDFGSVGETTYVTQYSNSGIYIRYYSDPPTEVIDADASYDANGIFRFDSTTAFQLPISTTQLAQWPDVPTTAEIGSGKAQVGVDTNTGDVYLAANVGGTIFKVQLV